LNNSEDTLGNTEFIIALTEHRFLGSVFVPFLIHKKEQFYTVKSLVKKRDLENTFDYHFEPYEKQMVEIIERYSDEKLMKKFSRAASVSDFYSSLRTKNFHKQVIPYIEKCMFEVANILMLSPVRLLNKQTKYANLYDEDEIIVQSLFAKPVFYFERAEKETRYQLKVFIEDKQIPLKSQKIRVVANEPCMLIHKNRLIVFKKLIAKKLIPFFEKEYVVVPHEIEEKYYPGFVKNTIRDFDVVASGFTIEEGETEKKAMLNVEQGLGMHSCLMLYFVYGEEKFLHNSGRKTAVNLQKKNGSFIYRKVQRDFTWEKEIFSKLNEAGLKEKNGCFIPPGLELLEKENALYVLINWLNKNKRSLEKNEIKVSPVKQDKTYYTGEQRLELKTKKEGDWFDVYATVYFGEYSIPFIKLKKYILNDIREFELPNGETAVLPQEWFARFKGILPFGKEKGEKIQYNKHHFPLLSGAFKQADKALLKKLQPLTKKAQPVALPVALNANLRAYQEDGFQWMINLFKKGFGGCLADDMGLGKTLQTLALLLKLKREKTPIEINDPAMAVNQLSLFEENKKNNIQPASLIVLPTSLVHNWEAEIKKFTPALKVYRHVGIQRKNAIEISKIARFYDVILTTYGTVRNDYKMMQDTEFFYLILDESQFIKNPSSKTYKAIMNVKSKHRLVLTGTPIENSLTDLWSQMNFLNKGLLGNLAFFKRSFITPVEKHKNKEQQEKLKLMIRPFILRRTKEEVAKDLPPLMEQVIYCEMTDGQRKFYEKEKSVIRNSILSSIEKEGIEKTGFIMLQGLTKLRQLANHPLLLEKENGEQSGKFDEIFRMLENLVAENHKVLIFSSFVKHLELLQQKIEENNWTFSKLVGSTSKREKVIRQFQENPDNRIFLISLKAGGVGLNLTEADYVFIIDPWWNPAAENQAINRAHRIGQDKHVFVYRFITENSIEEKIQLLKGRKSSLADKFINSNNPFKEISQEEIVELFN